MAVPFCSWSMFCCLLSNKGIMHVREMTGAGARQAALVSAALEKPMTCAVSVQIGKLTIQSQAEDLVPAQSADKGSPGAKKKSSPQQKPKVHLLKPQLLLHHATAQLQRTPDGIDQLHHLLALSTELASVRWVLLYSDALSICLSRRAGRKQRPQTRQAAHLLSSS